MKHQSFVDWMKAMGMLLIVTGHVFGDPFHIFNSVSQPIYTKQLGVAFFVFITGWSLANETRDGFRVVFNRIFPIYFYGFLFAVLLSTVYFSVGADINESNFLPFIGGINVFFNYFPANPTTWYIGTYLHLLLFWFFFIRGKEIGKRHLVMAFLFENIVRCTLLYWDQNMVAYMLLPNWLTVFILGGYLYKQRDSRWTLKVVWLSIFWVLVLVFWSSSFNLLHFDKSFPFRTLLFDGLWELPLRSLLISTIYLASTLVVFEITRRLPLFRIVSFFARNTLIIFIVHMPIIYALSQYFDSISDVVLVRKIVLVFMIYVGLAMISELVQKPINVKYYSNKSWNKLNKIFPNLSNK